MLLVDEFLSGDAEFLEGDAEALEGDAEALEATLFRRTTNSLKAFRQAQCDYLNYEDYVPKTPVMLSVVEATLSFFLLRRTLNSSTQHLNPSVRQGHWTIQMSYEQDGNSYYQEQILVVDEFLSGDAEALEGDAEVLEGDAEVLEASM